MKTKRKILKIISPLLIIIAGLFAFKIMVAHKRPPTKEAVVKSGTLVRILAVKQSDRQVDIAVTGTIAAREEISVIPQVSGKLVYVAPSFKTGAYFAAGEMLLKIAGIDYTLAIERAKAQVAKMEFALSAMQSRAKVAKDEWLRGHHRGELPGSDLVLYGPQLKEARANLTAARAVLHQAKINLARTRIIAPFNCRVRSEQIGLGQYVTTGSKMAVLTGSDEVEALAPVSMADLAWLRIPRAGSKKDAPRAIIQINSNGRVFSWSGRLARSLGEVNRVGKMVRLAVTVDDPYNLKATAPKDRPELALGMFVRIRIRGGTACGVITLPRSAMRGNNTVWLMTSDNKLKIVPVRVIRRERDEILIKGGIAANDRVVLTKIAGAINGMNLKLAGEQSE